MRKRASWGQLRFVALAMHHVVPPGGYNCMGSMEWPAFACLEAMLEHMHHPEVYCRAF